MSFQDELNKSIPTQEEKLADITKSAIIDANDDFDHIKKQLKYQIEQQDFSIRKNGTYPVTALHPDGIGYNCQAAYYFKRQDSVIQSTSKLGFLTLHNQPTYVTDYIIIDKQQFEIYNNYLRSLCAKEDITYKFIITDLNRPIAEIPGRVYSSNKTSNFTTYHVRIAATMQFHLNR